LESGQPGQFVGVAAAAGLIGQVSRQLRTMRRARARRTASRTPRGIIGLTMKYNLAASPGELPAIVS
jgi:hypothetical protein